MNPADIVAEAADLGLVLLHRRDKIVIRGRLPMPEDFAAELLHSKPAVLAHLRDRAERQREATVEDSWNRIIRWHDRHGRPSGWLTPDVLDAEREVAAAWLAARETADAEPRFLDALGRWEWRVLGAIAAADAEQLELTR